ncbi:hypothetical protein NUACC21_35780 [Scytonema sp. NUACC21]
MKVFFKVLAVSFLTSFILNVVYYTLGSAKEISVVHPKNADQAEIQSFAVTFPPVARVMLKEGGSRSGRLTAIDSQKQQLTIAQGGKSHSIAISQIEKVKFQQGDPTVPGGNDLPPIRGEQRTWTGILLSNIRIKDVNKGRAEVIFPPGISVSTRGGKLSLYVVQEVLFESDGKVTIQILIVN